MAAMAPRGRRCRSWIVLAASFILALVIVSFSALWPITDAPPPPHAPPRLNQSPPIIRSVKGDTPLAILAAAVESLLPPLERASPAQAEAALASALGVGGDGGEDQSSPASAAARAIVSRLSASPASGGCEWEADSTLPEAPGGEVYFLAGNLHNSEEIMQHYLAGMLRTLLRLNACREGFLSLYENGSSDSTPRWLRALGRLVTAMGCQHRIVAGLEKGLQPGQGRIDYLAGVRNKAMEPLYGLAAGAAGAAGAEGIVSSLGGVNVSMGRPSRVVFINDVLFCAEHVLRLAQHARHSGADLACGMDFDSPPASPGGLRKMRAAVGAPGGARMAFPEFYDIWVARDVEGHMFAKRAPFVQHPMSRARLAAGLPFPARCCWNGLVVAAAAPFIEHGIRFRSHRPGECASSECSLFCSDLASLGYARMVVDPGVRLAYEHRTRGGLRKGAGGVPPARPWAEVAAAAPIDWGHVPEKSYVMCCPLEPGHTMVEFGDLSRPWAVTGRPRCYQEDIFSPLPHPTVSLEAPIAARGG